jgi:hypothetical protein
MTSPLPRPLRSSLAVPLVAETNDHRLAGESVGAGGGHRLPLPGMRVDKGLPGAEEVPQPRPDQDQVEDDRAFLFFLWPCAHSLHAGTDTAAFCAAQVGGGA